MNSNLFKKVGIVLAAILVLLQFVQPARNLGESAGPDDISKVLPFTGNIGKTVEVSCNDCHSNRTNYPWYARIQPLGLWLKHHVDEGKEELNFSVFKTYSPKRQAHKMDELVEMLEENEMPLASYTLIHKDAVLSAEQKEELLNWAKEGAKQIRLANNLPEHKEEHGH